MSQDDSRKDADPLETQDWVSSLESVIEHEGIERAHYLLEALIDRARRAGANLPYKATTAYLNTIPVTEEERSPGDPELEYRIRSYIRWNAMAMVVQANKESSELGGHLASFASAATLYDVGFNHFFRGPEYDGGSDLIFIQGHSSPGVYARAYLEGRLTEDDLRRFRREVGDGRPGRGLSSYPHPWLMPDFWQFPTVSMGLGAIMAVQQARFMKYLDHRGIKEAKDRKVWCFLGDGEMDEPESLMGISLAAREGLDNLIFVINCNLQRLDGPVRGNGKIIQELEGVFRGAGWNVLKVLWGDRWDPLFAKDKKGLLLQRMEEAVDGDYQNYKAKGGTYTREHFFGKRPELLQLVANLTDNDIWLLNRGGHDPQKIYAAYARAVKHKGQPTCILAKTVKGYGLGEAGEGKNITHQVKKMAEEHLQVFRDRYRIPVPDEKLAEAPLCKFPENSRETQYLHARRKALGGYLPARRVPAPSLEIPDLSYFEALLQGSGEHEQSTTMAFVRILTALCRHKSLGKHVVPIVPDEARTFGMDGLFRQLGIYAAQGQLYEPVDSDQVLYYREDKKGQILEEGICEAGALAAWIAAGTSYANNGVPMVPFYIFYSMFGFQRVMDLIWAGADSRTRGFLLGGTSGRTTLSGEGLQHQDGHSQVLAETVPTCVSYDPTYAYELAVIIQDGLRRMYGKGEDIFYYITVLNENYPMPPMPKGVEQGILRGMYLLREGKGAGPRVQLLGSGAILREVLAGAELLEKDFGVAADVWSVTSFNELRRDGLECERWNTLHPGEKPRKSYVDQCLSARKGPVVASTDYVKLYADEIRPFVPKKYKTLGTDGFGRSDLRKGLRSFFEVDRHHVAVAALSVLADEEAVPASKAKEAIAKYKIDPERKNPAKA
ncbi:MAG: pyruvate dehydrogenase (acetyl-transferring), homodimeric type [Bdellovibrionota bacterium]